MRSLSWTVWRQVESFAVFLSSLVWLSLSPLFSLSPPPKLPMARELPPGFVGGNTCRSCHPRQYQTYQTVAMARSLYEPTSANDPEFKSQAKNLFFHAKSGYYYEMAERGGKFYQKRFLRDAQGKPIRIRQEEITYVVGSGNHARTYLRHHSDGRITQLPVSWYPQEKTWGMSPGYDSRNHADFSRDVNHDCVFCHTSYPKVIPSLASIEKFFPYQLPLGIDCERCHGPGERHVQLVRSNAPVETIRKAVFQPARASKELQRELCYQCHFEAGTQFARDRLSRPEADAFAYRPGESLSNFIINLDYAPKDRPSDEFKIAHQGYRMEQSICFQRSQGKMTCTQCHDPHQGVDAKDKVQWFRSKCIGCHQVGSCIENAVVRRSQNDDCVSCHMWKRRAEDAVHTIMTDHKIQRSKPKRNFLEPLPEKNAMNKVDKDLIFYGSQLLRPFEREYFLGMAYLQLPPEQLAMSSRQQAKGVELLQQFLTGVESLPNRSNYAGYLSRAYLMVASAYHDQGRREFAFDACQRSLQHDPNFVPAHRYKCGLLTESGKPQEAFECFQESLTLDPWDARVYMSIGSLYAGSRLFDHAIQFLQMSLSVDPDNAVTHYYLGDALAEKGDLSASISSYEKALNLEPRDPEVYWDYALVLQKQGRHDLAIKFIQNGLYYAPTAKRGLDMLSKARMGRSQPSEATTEPDNGK
jgi:tetratricopeptide (TPR) repeat protein